MATRFVDHLLTGDHASRPAFGDVPQGTLYACSDHGLVYQSDGSSAWSTWATLGGSGGAPDDVDYLVGTASGDLSAEIVVGTSPGGELGGTWASPTVDANHGGGTHAATQAAAEATAAAALSGHTGDTSDAHDASAISLADSGGNTDETDVEAAIAELYGLIAGLSGGGGTASAVKVYAASAQTLASGVAELVDFSNEELDTDGYFNSGSSVTNLVVPSGFGGVFLLIGYVFSSTNTTFVARFKKNGTIVRGQSTSGGSIGKGMLVSAGPVALADADVVTLEAILFANGNIGDGTNAEQQCWASLTRIGD